MEMYMDEKWKLSKKGSCRRSSNGRREIEGGGGFLKRSASAMESRENSQRSFTSRCASLVKEQRARFYIMRRCVTMLVCWRDYP